MVGRAHALDVEGVTVAWGELGQGEPLVLLHGLVDSGRTWRRAAPLLARRYRVLTPDLPGHGWSARPDAPYTMEWYARILGGWLAAIGVRRAHLCGHSYGGGLALWLLLEERVEVGRLGLVATGGLGREIGLPMRLGAVPVLGPALSPLVLEYLIPPLLPVLGRFIGHMEPAERVRVLRDNRVPGTARAFQRALEGVVDVFGQRALTPPNGHGRAELPPTALFWGRKDPVIPVRHAIAAAARCPGLGLTIYERCGHYPHLDAAERFAADLLTFLADDQRPAIPLACFGRSA